MMANQYNLAERQQESFEQLMVVQLEEPSVEAVVCKKFGCGRHLSFQQQLFGHYCPDHQEAATVPNINDPSNMGNL